MPSKPVTVRLGSAEIDALSKYPGHTTAERIRAAILRGGIADGIASRVLDGMVGVVRREVEAALRDAVADLEIEIRGVEQAVLGEIDRSLTGASTPSAVVRPESRPSRDPIIGGAVDSLRAKGIIK